MSQMLILNPAKRRRSSGTTKKRRASGAKRRRVHRNPSSAVATVKRAIKRRVSRVSARKNPFARRRRVRRNPIGLGSLRGSSIVNMLKDAAIGGAGAVGIDFLFAKVAPYIPASIQTNDAAMQAVRVALTIAAGRLLKKPTKGLSEKMAVGALIVQAYNVIQSYMPAASVNGIGYMTPAKSVNMSQRIGPRQTQPYRLSARVNNSAVLSGRIPQSAILSGRRSVLG